MNWRCRWFRHRWKFNRNEPFEDNAGHEQKWFWEVYKCERCGTENREVYDARLMGRTSQRTDPG